MYRLQKTLSLNDVLPTILWTAFLVNMLGTVQVHADSPVSPKASATTVLMLEIRGFDTQELDQAILAQLSISDQQVKQLQVWENEFKTAAPLTMARTFATEYSAQMVFWVVDDGVTCTVYFYTKEDNDHIYQRVLRLESREATGRYEVIANATASLVEDTVIAIQKSTAKTIEPKPVTPTSSPKRAEVFAGYAGTLFSKSSLTHAVRVGMGMLPANHMGLRVAYARRFVQRWSRSTYAFSLSHHQIDIGIAGVWQHRRIGFRLGIDYCMALRTFDLSSRSDTVTARPSALEMVHGLKPFIQLEWLPLTPLSLYVSFAGALWLNEPVYRISVENSGSQLVVRPYSVQPATELGFRLAF